MTVSEVMRNIHNSCVNTWRSHGRPTLKPASPSCQIFAGTESAQNQSRDRSLSVQLHRKSQLELREGSLLRML